MDLIEQMPERYRWFVTFLSQTGLRISEAVALTWDDVDLDRGVVHVRRRAYKGIDEPKSRYGVRSIPLTPTMTATLRTLSEATEGVFLVTSDSGRALIPTNWSVRTFKPACVRAGVPWATIHTLRHTCASRMFRAGLNLLAISKILGHHSATFTLSTYVHMTEAELPDVSFMDGLAV